MSDHTPTPILGFESQKTDEILHRLPVRWAGAQMVVNENVLINAPFRPEDCQAPKGNEAGLARVKKVVENERRKYAERSDGGARGAKPANATPVRKGG